MEYVKFVLFTKISRFKPNTFKGQDKPRKRQRRANAFKAPDMQLLVMIFMNFRRKSANELGGISERALNNVSTICLF